MKEYIGGDNHFHLGTGEWPEVIYLYAAQKSYQHAELQWHTDGY